MPDTVEYLVDLDRLHRYERLQLPGTGLYIRAKAPDPHGRDAYDLVTLELDSLRRWLLSRGGDNPWAERVVAILLRHDRDAIEKAWGV